MQAPVSHKRSMRSRKVALTTMAALGGGAMLSACGGGSGAPAANAADTASAAQEGTEVQVFENIFTCANITGKTRDECEEMRQEALAQAEAEAPRYEALQDCESEYGAGQCVENGVGQEREETSYRRSSFSPFVVAWFSSKNSNTPLFKSKAGGYQTANGTRLGYGGQPGKYYASNRALERTKSVPRVKPASQMAKAGGFGDRNRSWNLSDRNGGTSRSATSSSRSSRSRGG